MATGSMWNDPEGAKPWADFDVNAIIDIPIELADWLTSLGALYASHTITADAPLECVTSSHASSVVTARIKVADGASFQLGSKYPFTVRLICDDGQQDERTLWLKLVQR